MQNAADQLKRRPDGSIDTEHYMARGRQERARTFQDALPERPASRGILAGLALAALAVVTLRAPGA